MEMAIVKRRSLKHLALAIPAFILFTVSGNPAKQDLSSAFDVVFLGGDNESLLFNVRYDNKAGHRFRLSVIDETGEACFQDNYSAKDFVKKIKIPRLTDTDYVIFLIRSAKGNIQLSYKVSVTTKVV